MTIASAKAGILVAAVAAFLAVGLIPHQLRADGNVISPGLHGGEKCNGWARISDSEATCLTATIDNDVGSGEDRPFSGQNECSDYGSVLAHVDVNGAEDKHMHLGSSQVDGRVAYDVAAITCCIDKSDLCYKNQVEADQYGRIQKITISGPEIDSTWIKVATHWQRYNYCKDNADDLYCTVDPEGDANTNPTPSTGDCDGRACTIKHCRDNFADSAAAGSPSSCESVSLDYPEWPGDPDTPNAERTDDKWHLTDNECPVSGADNCTYTVASFGDFTVSPVAYATTQDAIDSQDATTSHAAAAVNVHDVDELRFCRWSYCTDSGALTAKSAIVADGCPESVASCASTASTGG